MRRAFLSGLVCLSVLVVCGPRRAASDDAGQETGDPSFERIAERYLKILRDRPQQGVAFDRLYRHYLDAGRLDELIATLQSNDDSGSFSTQMLLGFVRERREDADGARTAYEAAERIDGEQFVAPYALGMLHFRAGRYDSAAECLSRALACETSIEESLEAHQQVALAWLRLDRRDEALAVLRTLADEFPADARILRQLARFLDEQGEPEEAIRRWEQVAALPDQDGWSRVEARMAIADLRVRLQKTEAAVILLDETLRDVRPGSWLADTIWGRIRRIYQSTDDADGFVQFCQERVDRHPEDVDARLRLARAFAAIGNGEDSIAALRSAMTRAPSRRDIREELIHQLVLSNAFKQAVVECESLLAFHPDDADLLARLGELQLRLETGDGQATRLAIAAWRRIAEIRAGDPLYAVRAAEMCRRSLLDHAAADAVAGKDDRSRALLIAAAEGLYREAVARAPEVDEHYEHLGAFLHEQGRRADAVAACAEIVADGNATADDWHRLAEIYASFGYLPESVAALDTAVGQQPDRFEWRVLRFDLLLELEVYDRADDDWLAFDRLADGEEQRRIARERRILFLRTTDRIDEEIARLQKRRSDATASSGDLWILALLLSERWRHEEAREAFEATMALKPRDVPLLRDYARALEFSGNLARTVSLLRRVVEFDSRRRLEDYERLASLELRIGDHQSARETIQELRRLAPDRQATFVLQADLEFQAGDPAAGLEALRRAVQLAPREIESRGRLADALARHGRPADAVEHYWRCFELTSDLDEQRTLLTALFTIRSTRREQFLERLHRLREQEEDPRALTFCITAALRSIRRFDEARRELESLLLRNERDQDVLRELTAIAVQQHAWSDAADYQVRIAAITEREDDLRVLLRYYRSANRHEDATRVWEKLLTSDDPQVYLDEVDRMLREVDLNDAISLAQIGLSKSPGNWPLLLRSAVARMVRGNFEEAGRYFEAAADATLSKSNVAPGDSTSGAVTGGADPLQELRTAEAALSDLERIIQAQGSQRGNWLGRVLNAFRFPDNVNDAHIAAVLGSYVTALRGGSESAWIRDRLELGEADRRFWRHLIWVLSASDQLASNKAFVDRYIEQLPHDALPHLARLRQPRVPSAVYALSPDARSADHDGLLASYRWLIQNRPPLKAEYVFKYGTDMLMLGDDDEAVSAFIDALEHDSADVRAQAAIALRRTGAAGLRSLPHLVDRLADHMPQPAVESATTLGLMGPDAAPAIAPLIALFDSDSLPLRQESALAVGRIGPVAIPPLTAALLNEGVSVRHGAVLALSHMGRQAAPALPELISAIDDDSPDVQRRAVMALAGFEADAAVAVPELLGCLESADSQLVVATLNTLASIGAPADEAVAHVLELLDHDERRIRYVSAHALRRIAPEVAELKLGPNEDAVGAALADIGTLDVGAGDWPQWGGWSGRNNSPEASGIPATWDIETGLNVKWSAPLGSQTYGNPSVANGKVFIGTNNHHGYIPRFPKTVDLGVMLCFDEQTGSFLWQYSSPKLPTGRVHDWPEQGMPSTPVVDGDRLWAVTNRCEVVCLDTEGFMDGENDGPFTQEPAQNPQEADVVWKFDMMGELGVSPHNMSTCCIVTVGGKLFVCTSNGVDESHVNIPAPDAPSFIAMDRETGRVLWTDNSPGQNILHGQWASPTYGVFESQPQIVFPGGDGWLYSFDPDGDGRGNSKLLWKLDANPKEALYSVRGRSQRNHMIGFACNYQGLLYIAVGEDPEHGEGDGHLWCIDPAHRMDGSDVSAELAVDAAGNPLPQRRLQAVVASAGERAIPNPDSAVVWHYTGHDLNDNGKLEYEEQMHRALSTPVIRDDLLYMADFSGIVHCINAITGVSCWTYDMFSQSWGSALIADNKVYVGNEEGRIYVFGHSPDPEVAMRNGEPLADNDMQNSVYTTPIVANNVLFITNKSTLFAMSTDED